MQVSLPGRARPGAGGTVRNVIVPFEVGVVGTSYHQDEIMRLTVGDEISVVPEPTNPFDSCARAVYARGVRIGYLAKGVSSRMAREGVGELKGAVAFLGGHSVRGVKVTVTDVVGSVPVQIVVRPEPEPVPTRAVRVRGSGRLVGTLLRADRERGRVLVRGTAGEVEYDDTLVIIDEVLDGVGSNVGGELSHAAS
jgi:hypothetical protein